MDGPELQAILTAMEESRKEHRQDLGRVHDRLDKAMSEATSAATQGVVFQAATTNELKNIGARFDIQNGRLYKAEQEILAMKARASFSEGEIAAREKLLGMAKAVAGVVKQPWPWAFLAIAGSAALTMFK
ncbi:MAG: hypothetical protein IT301_15150 [Dehalococcoidia bacterium]|nr:hypothetical protein [Dehalococcoidia bacterium]